jgi:LacI family transcriptional regulator
MTKQPAPPLRPATILDIAAEAKLSKSTVSLVLQGSALIRPETAERVREAARKLGYIYNRRAAELRRQASNTVGVVINDLMNPFFAEVLVGLERKLDDAGYTVLMAHTSESLDRQAKVLQAMREQGAAGIALCPVLGTPASLVRTVKTWGIPLVVMVRTLGRGSYDFAGADNSRGVQMATEHLIRTGHRRIAFIGGRTGPVLDQRLNGYRQALAEAGLPFDESLVFAANPTRKEGFERMGDVLDRMPRVAAAVCYNDLVAFGALAALGARGLRAGRDFALMGFDNVLDAEHSNPPLSTVNVRPSEIGEQAAAVMLERILDPKRSARQFVAQPSLVLRDSA